jgi:hypothetical protein
MKNAVAFPITDGQKPIPLGVLQVYNYESGLLSEELM